mmetsp:Transcript_48923/g.153676  ORF Transcript_48923/g.153676 Transcript_48923/m.153676 type:complete len:293 (-) Transcript_48923:520-1398(-)
MHSPRGARTPRTGRCLRPAACQVAASSAPARIRCPRGRRQREGCRGQRGAGCCLLATPRLCRERGRRTADGETTASAGGQATASHPRLGPPRQGGRRARVWAGAAVAAAAPGALRGSKGSGSRSRRRSTVAAPPVPKAHRPRRPRRAALPTARDARRATWGRGLRLRRWSGSGCAAEGSHPPRWRRGVPARPHADRASAAACPSRCRGTCTHRAASARAARGASPPLPPSGRESQCTPPACRRALSAEPAARRCRGTGRDRAWARHARGRRSVGRRGRRRHEPSPAREAEAP